VGNRGVFLGVVWGASLVFLLFVCFCFWVRWDWWFLFHFLGLVLRLFFFSSPPAGLGPMPAWSGLPGGHLRVPRTGRGQRRRPTSIQANASRLPRTPGPLCCHFPKRPLQTLTLGVVALDKKYKVPSPIGRGLGPTKSRLSTRSEMGATLHFLSI
jgi:hypothetical protein